MKKYLVLATMFMLSSAVANAATMTWYGSAGWRYNKSSSKDGTTTTGTTGTSSGKVSERTEKAHMFRGEIGAMGGWDNVEWGLGVRTTGSAANTLLNTPTMSAVNNDWTTTNGNAGFGIELDNAWFKYGNDWGFGDIGVVFGRQAAAFMTGTNQVFIDSDVRFDGVAETWQWGSFGLNLSQYILGATSAGTAGNSTYIENEYSQKFAANPGSFAVLYSFQPTFKWKFSDEIAAMFAVGYHKWSGTIGTNYQNLIPNGGNNGFGAGAQNTVATTLGNTGTWANRVSQENSRMWQFLMNWQLPFMLAVDFELIKNKDQYYAAPSAPGALDNFPTPRVKQDSTAWAAGISYGQLKKAQDFMVGYSYHDKGLGAVHNRFTYDRVAAGFGAHEINAAYNVANNFHVAGKAIFLNEKTGKIQTGVDQGKKLETNYWEIATGVKF